MNRMTPPQSTTAVQDIGGAMVRRLIERGGEIWKRPGDRLSAAEVAEISKPNLIALRDAGYLQVFPKDPGTAIAPELAPIATTRFPIHRGCGKYDVIEGVQLNDHQLSKDEAEALVAAGTNPKN